MTNYKNRLKDLKDSWERDKAVKAQPQLPDGTYQFEIKQAKLSESTASFNKGHLQVEIHLVVAVGPLKGRKHINRIDLEAKADVDKGFPSGISRFKGLLETLEVDMPKRLDEDGIQKSCAQLIGVVCEGACKINAKGYANVYINELVNADSASDDDESEDDEDSDESDDDEDSEDESDDDEDDEDEEEKPAPKQEKAPFKVEKQTKKEEKPSKKPPPKEDKEEDDEDDWSKEFEDDK